jgi:hypothetical protein
MRESKKRQHADLHEQIFDVRFGGVTKSYDLFFATKKGCLHVGCQLCTCKQSGPSN